jgi:undecaprenyl-diphosphatase
MTFTHIVVLAIIQGLAELLPISSSAHVVVAERLFGMDPSAPAMTLLLVMLHTGTMFAVIVYFWRQWGESYFQNRAAFSAFAARLIAATAFTGVIGGSLMVLAEHTLLRGAPHAQIEDLFDHLELIAPALAAVGLLICIAGWIAARGKRDGAAPSGAMSAGPVATGVAVKAHELSLSQASLIGILQGVSLPFRGFSRSGATISTGLLLGVNRVRAEAFSFALAVVLTPPVIARGALRLVRASDPAGAAASSDLSAVVWRCVLGAVLAFLAGLGALRWLSRWLESGRWYLFGIYCLVAAGVVALLHRHGY